MATSVQLVNHPDQIAAVLEQARRASRVALDIESNGLYAYRPRLCTIQLAWGRDADDRHVVVIDSLTVDPNLLQSLLAVEAPLKVIHDLAFDARLLHAFGLVLRGVHDTAVAASMLGRPATGLASLLSSELGISVDKSMQVSDWARRPLEQGALHYLADDVAHLLALEDVLWSRVCELGIEPEVQTECEYRLASAYAPEQASLPPFARIRGADKLDDVGRAVLKQLAGARERMAEAADVPVFKIAHDLVLLDIAARRPTSSKALKSLGRKAQELPEQVVSVLLEAVIRGVADGALSEQDAARLQHAPFDREAADARKRREKKLSAWRESEARRRGVHDQVVLPGHCMRRLASGTFATADEIGALEGFGRVRAQRYGEELARLLQETGER